MAQFDDIVGAVMEHLDKFSSFAVIPVLKLFSHESEILDPGLTFEGACVIQRTRISL